jgi:hypothetical protein
MPSSKTTKLFENLALVINRTAQAMPLTVDFHKHLVNLPPPVPEPSHP